MKRDSQMENVTEPENYSEREREKGIDRVGRGRWRQREKVIEGEREESDR